MSFLYVYERNKRDKEGNAWVKSFTQQKFFVSICLKYMLFLVVEGYHRLPSHIFKQLMYSSKIIT